ncbi:MAG: response regulator transcription factor [Dehalococcoidia bacterium]
MTGNLSLKVQMTMNQVLIIDSDESRRHLVLALQEDGFRVLEETKSNTGIGRVLSDGHYPIIMSEDMPPVDDLDLLSALRSLTDSPIVVLGTGDEATMVQALLRGADLYLPRPVNPGELIARMRALLRRHRDNRTPSPEESGLNTTFDGVQLGKIWSQLSQTETRLLRFLLERSERLVGRDELLNGVWGDEGKDTSLRFYIWQLRKKLAEASSLEILNLKGMGYLLKVYSKSN